MPLIKTKPADIVVKKWQARAGGAGNDYATGVANPKRDQAAAAAAAAQTWATGVQQAVTNGTFAKNVLAAKDKYVRNATGKGAQRYPGGITAAVPDFSNKIDKVLSVLNTIDVPSRMPKGDPGNWQISMAVGQALRAAKIAGKFA